MKKVLLSMFVVCGVSAVSFAQGFYLKVQGGYNFEGLQNNSRLTAPRVDAGLLYLGSDGLVPMANIRDYTTSDQYGSKVYTSTAPIKGSYGAGGNVGGAVGYMFNKWFGLELGANYLWSKTYTSSVTTLNKTAPSTSNPNGTLMVPQPVEATITTSSQGLTVYPTLVFVAAVPKWPVEPYAKVGLAMPVYGKSGHQVDVTLPDELTDNTMFNAPRFLGKKNHMETQTEGTVSLGVNWAIGIRYTPKQLSFLTVFLESNGQWLNVRAKSTKITVYETLDENGVMVDRLNNSDATLNRPMYRQEINYHDEIDENSNNVQTNPNYDSTKPKDDIRPIAPFSNIGIQVGIQLNFSKEALGSLKKKKAE